MKCVCMLLFHAIFCLSEFLCKIFSFMYKSLTLDSSTHEHTRVLNVIVVAEKAHRHVRIHFFTMKRVCMPLFHVIFCLSKFLCKIFSFMHESLNFNSCTYERTHVFNAIVVAKKWCRARNKKKVIFDF